VHDAHQRPYHGDARDVLLDALAIVARRSKRKMRTVGQL